MAVKYFDWDDAKNATLRAERGIGFEDVVFHIERGDLLDILWNTRTPPLRRPAHLGRSTRGVRARASCTNTRQGGSKKCHATPSHQNAYCGDAR
jgi:uncharacterized DUF497 family protein